MYTIRMLPPKINPNSGFTHASTSWQISKDNSFEDDTQLLVSSMDDTDHLIEYVYDNVDLLQDTIFVRVKLNYSNGNSSKWSRTIPVHKDHAGIKFSNTIVSTPKLTIAANSETDTSVTDITVDAGEFKLFGGIGRHQSTSWYLEDTNKEVIWKREKDEEFLTNISIPKKYLSEDRAFVIKCKFHTDTNTDSKFGTVLISTGETRKDYFFVDETFAMYSDKWNFIKVLSTHDLFESFDLFIVDPNGVEVKRFLNQTDNESIKYETFGLEKQISYDIKIRVKLSNDVYSDFITIKRRFSEYVTYPFAVNANTYNNNASFLQEINFGGRSTIVSKETISNVLFTMKNNDNKVYTQVFKNNNIYDLGPSGAVLEDAYDMPHLNSLQIENGDILFNYDTKSDTTVFKTYGLNTSNNALTLKQTKEFTDMQNGACYTNSIVSLKDGLVAFIPGRMKDDSDLKLHVINTIDMTSKSFTLPFAVKRNVILVPASKTKILLTSGTKADDTRNNESYLLDIEQIIASTAVDTTAFQTKVANIEPNYSADKKELLATQRPDGKVVIYNNEFSDHTIGGDQATMTYDIETDTYTIHENDWYDNEFYNTTYILNNGYNLRISNRVKDAQLVYGYINETASTKDGITVITNLFIGENDVIEIEAPFTFNEITFSGNGILKVISDV